MTNIRRENKYWGHVARNSARLTHFDDLMAEQYRRVHLELINRWADVKGGKRILKTDLFAEAVNPNRAFLWEILKANNDIVGIDISAEMASLAKVRAGQYDTGSLGEYLNCDVRKLPFANNCFDLIISDSTLDHFQHKRDIVTALSELARVLKPGGTLIITMDNKTNFTEPLFRIWIFLGFSPFFIGKTYSMKELKTALNSVGLSVLDETAIIHNPRFFTRSIITLLRRINPEKFNGLIREVLPLLDGLERRRTKYLTGQFIAAKAMKIP